ncbi:MAG: MATE family efflux transporter [Oscillospiraceae bacterium]|jgi:putative MATE family efflux protein
MTKDLTTGSPTRLIIMFTIPLLIGNIFQQFYNMADTLIVGRTIGPDALAAVGCTGSIMFFIIGFAQGMTSGLSIVTAQRFGAGDAEGVRRSFATGVWVCLFITLILTAVSVLLARPILEVMQTPSDIIDQAYQYIVVIYAGIGASVLFNFLSNILRALGDSRTPLIFLVIASILNVGLDLAFIIWFHMGVAGAGLATVIAQAVSGLLCLIYIIKRFHILHPQRGDWRQTKEQLFSHLRLSIPMGFQSSIIAIGTITVQIALNSLGTTAVAAYTAASKIDNLCTMPGMSFGVTMATYSAQNYGANLVQRIKTGVRQCCIISCIVAVVLGLMNIFAGKFLIMAFVGAESTAIIDLAQIMLTINGICYVSLALLFIFRSTLQGLGKSFIPTLSGVVELCVRIFAAVVLAALLGFTGACLANVMAWISAGILLCIAYFATMKKILHEPALAEPKPVYPEGHVEELGEEIR